MVYLVTGTVGGGKSMFAAEKAYDLWTAGGYVTSNMDFIPDAVIAKGWGDRYVDLREIDPEKWVEQVVGGEEGRENLVIIDEGALIFNVRDQMKTRDTNKVFFEFAAWSRRYGVDLYFISQDPDNIDVVVRRMCGFLIHCVQVKNIPIIGPVVASWLGEFKRYQMTPKKRSVIRSTYNRFRKEVGAIYDTHGFIGRKVTVNRKVPPEPPKSKAVWISNLVIVTTILTIIFGGWGWYNAMFGVRDVSPKKDKTVMSTLQPDGMEWHEENTDEIIRMVQHNKSGLVIFATPPGSRAVKYKLGEMVNGHEVTGINKWGDGYIVTINNVQHVTRWLNKEERSNIWKQKQHSLLARSQDRFSEDGSRLGALERVSASFVPQPKNSP